MALTFFISWTLKGSLLWATPSLAEEIKSDEFSEITKYCIQALKDLPGPYNKQNLQDACKEVQQLPDCTSEKGVPIFHFDRKGEVTNAKRIFAISLIHGDELASGSVTRAWMSRLKTIDPRNEWRVIPIVSPDGLKVRTRTNANKVDINRNFPSEDWNKSAVHYWQTKTRKDPRRFPGPSAASEKETRCIVNHLAEFKPDFVISIHTPFGLLDFDGPKLPNPNFKPLPWVGLGNYPGSLGRYLWVDRKIPVLTIELKGASGLKKLEDFDALQDITGTVAIQASQILDSTKDIKKTE